MVTGFYGRLGEDGHGKEKATYMDWRLDALRNRQSIFVRGWFESSSTETLAESSADRLQGL